MRRAGPRIFLDSFFWQRGAFLVHLQDTSQDQGTSAVRVYRLFTDFAIVQAVFQAWTRYVRDEWKDAQSASPFPQHDLYWASGLWVVECSV